MTAGMKRNVNFGLLILIIAVLICFIAASIYYQKTFDDVNLESKSKLSELQKVTSTLLQKKEELAETSAKKETLETKYTDIKEEKETLEEQLQNTKDQLESTRNELIQSKDDLRKEKELSATYLAQRDVFSSQYTSEKSKVSSICSYIEDSIDGGLALTLPDECPE